MSGWYLCKTGKHHYFGDSALVALCGVAKLASRKAPEVPVALEEISKEKVCRSCDGAAPNPKREVEYALWREKRDSPQWEAAQRRGEEFLGRGESVRSARCWFSVRQIECLVAAAQQTPRAEKGVRLQRCFNYNTVQSLEDRGLIFAYKRGPHEAMAAGLLFLGMFEAAFTDYLENRERHYAVVGGAPLPDYMSCDEAWRLLAEVTDALQKNRVDSWWDGRR